MHALFRSPRRFAALAIAAATLAAGACKDSTGPDDFEPDVHVMRLTIAAQTPVTVSSTGVQTGTLTIARGVATTVTVAFLNAAGADVLGTHAGDFQASVAPAAGITFVRTGAYTGTLTGASAGVVAVRFGLFHIANAHDDFGPFPVNVTVSP